MADVPRDAIHNVQEIVRAEVRLAKAEVMQKATKTKPSLAYLASRAVVFRISRKGSIMPKVLRQLLVEEMRSLLHAEGQLIVYIPKMAGVAHHPKLKATFSLHLSQTEVQAERLRAALRLLGERPLTKVSKAMMGLVDECQDSIRFGARTDEVTADLSLISIAQKVEHFEIAGYSTARNLAREIGQTQVAVLMTQTLGEEERADFLLAELSRPLIHQSRDAGDYNGSGEVGRPNEQFKHPRSDGRFSSKQFPLGA